MKPSAATWFKWDSKDEAFLVPQKYDLSVFHAGDHVGAAVHCTSLSVSSAIQNEGLKSDK